MGTVRLSIVQCFRWEQCDRNWGRRGNGGQGTYGWQTVLDELSKADVGWGLWHDVKRKGKEVGEWLQACDLDSCVMAATFTEANGILENEHIWRERWLKLSWNNEFMSKMFCVPPHLTFFQFIVTKRCNWTADPWWNSFQQISVWGAECREPQNEGNSCCFLISLLGKLLSFLTLATLSFALVTLSFCLRFLLWNRNQQQCVLN